MTCLPLVDRCDNRFALANPLLQLLQRIVFHLVCEQFGRRSGAVDLDFSQGAAHFRFGHLGSDQPIKLQRVLIAQLFENGLRHIVRPGLRLAQIGQSLNTAVGNGFVFLSILFSIIV